MVPEHGSMYLEGGGSSRQVFPEKNLKLFQILILFDNDIEESVKTTNVLKCNFNQSVLSTITKLCGEHAPQLPRRGPNFFLSLCAKKIFLRINFPPNKKSSIEPC